MKTKTFGSMSFKIDRPKGTVKEWPQADGTVKRFVYPVDYGYLPRHTGEDDEGLDFFVGDDPEGHLESFQKLKRNDDGQRALDETKFLVGVTDADRETIYRLYGSEVWHRKVYRSLDELKEDLGKFQPKRKGRYGEKKAHMSRELYDVLMEKDAFSFADTWGKVRTGLQALRGHAPAPHATPQPHAPTHAPTLAPLQWHGGEVRPMPATQPGPRAPVATPPTPSGPPAPLSWHGGGPMSQVPQAPPPQRRPEAAVNALPLSDAFVPGRASRDRETFQQTNTKHVNLGLGGWLAHMSPEGEFLRTDPNFSHLVYDRQGMPNMNRHEELDALAHHLMAHQAGGGQIDGAAAHRILGSPAYRQTLQRMKTSALQRQAKVAALARYGFKQADAKFADIDKRIMGEIEMTGPNPMDWAFSRMTGPQLTAGAETSSTPGARDR